MSATTIDQLHKSLLDKCETQEEQAFVNNAFDKIKFDTSPLRSVTTCVVFDEAGGPPKVGSLNYTGLFDLVKAQFENVRGFLFQGNQPLHCVMLPKDETKFIGIGSNCITSPDLEHDNDLLVAYERCVNYLVANCGRKVTIYCTKPIVRHGALIVTDKKEAKEVKIDEARVCDYMVRLLGLGPKDECVAGDVFVGTGMRRVNVGNWSKYHQ